MKPGGYEAHMTFPLEHAARVKEIGEARGWKFSQIAGCPFLGSGTYCYLTGYAVDALELLDEMNAMHSTLAFSLIVPLRKKIEHIVYDTKTGVNEL